MFKSTSRLTKTKDIEKVFKQGTAYYNKLLGIKVLKNDSGINRLTVIISNKVNKQAVKRNRIKRQVRAILQTELPKLSPGFDLAVVCLPEINNQAQPAIEQAVIEALTKLKLY